MSYSSNQPLFSNQLPISIEWPKDQNRFLEELDNTYKRIADAVNTKVGSYFLLQELASFKRQYTLNNSFSFRSVYRYTYDIISQNAGNVDANATVNFVTNISGLVSLSNIYGTATTTSGKMFGLVYPYLYVEGNFLYVTNPEGVALNQCMVVLEYVKE